MHKDAFYAPWLRSRWWYVRSNDYVWTSVGEVVSITELTQLGVLPRTCAARLSSRAEIDSVKGILRSLGVEGVRAVRVSVFARKGKHL